MISSQNIHPNAVPEPPEELVSFVERQLRNVQPYLGVERRFERRYLMVVPVLVQRVDEQLNPIGDPFAVVTRDITPKGIGLVHWEPIDQARLALQMTLAGEEVCLLARALWSQAFGPYYYAGCELLAKLQAFPRPEGASAAAPHPSKNLRRPGP